MTNIVRDAKQEAETLAKKYTKRQQLNEAATRRRIIDHVMSHVLSWPESAVLPEKHTSAGFLDYLLVSEGELPILVVEAKKSGQHFELPRKYAKAIDEIHRVRLAILLSHKPIKLAVEQAKNYATAHGANFAMITNGFEWIIFRAFVFGRKYDDLDAIVIPSLQTFSTNFTEATNLLGFNSIVNENSLSEYLPAREIQASQVYCAKQDIQSYDALVDYNEYARYLEPIARRVFQDIPKDDTEFMEQCYVLPRKQQSVESSIRKQIKDQMTPYLETDGASDIQPTRSSGGKLEQRIARNLHNIEGADVVILFGGKGCGKSTFIERILFHKKINVRGNVCLPVVLDLIDCPHAEDALRSHIWQMLLSNLDVDGLLSAGIDQLATLFSDRFEIAQRQDLSGLPTDSTEFVTKRNSLVSEWKNDFTYASRSLAKHLRHQSRIPVVVLDNTDQLQGHLQDLCFLTAREISHELNCLVILSMREERYFRAKASGALAAYHNNGYHLPAPSAKDVFLRRFSYIQRVLKEPNFLNVKLDLPTNAPADALCTFIGICQKDFANAGNLSKFLDRCSQNNLRLALDFFRSFASSGYTNIVEMLNKPSWTLARHHVIKPMMVPTRHNYDEDMSQIPNAYKLRAASHFNSSHFTLVRLLRRLREIETASGADGFVSISNLIAEFEDQFNMQEDCQEGLDIMLRTRLVEADNRMESFRERIGETDEYIYANSVRVTPYGLYFLEELSNSFTYLELICFDTGVRNERLHNEFCVAARKERKFAQNHERLKRVESRLKRVGKLLDYLAVEEEKEKETYNLSARDFGLVAEIESGFQAEANQISISAKRNFDV